MGAAGGTIRDGVEGSVTGVREAETGDLSASIFGADAGAAGAYGVADRGGDIAWLVGAGVAGLGAEVMMVGRGVAGFGAGTGSTTTRGSGFGAGFGVSLTGGGHSGLGPLGGADATWVGTTGLTGELVTGVDLLALAGLEAICV
jgi:hypothetical protein